MRIEFSELDGFDNVIKVTMAGMWNQTSILGMVMEVERRKPKHLVLDLTDMILASEHQHPVEESSQTRQEAIGRMADLMLANPDMLYILVCPAQNPVFKTTTQYFESRGVSQQFKLVSKMDEALKIIRAHH